MSTMQSSVQHRPFMNRAHAGPRVRSSPGLGRLACRASTSRHFSSFPDGSLDNFSIAVLGDLHLAPDQMPLFDEARKQLQHAMSDDQGCLKPGARVVQLGDLGNSKHKPGSRQCFQSARQYMQSFDTPYAMILGNHDLEGLEFQRDEDNLQAWIEEFEQPHYWCMPLGPAVAIGLSTIRFRSNINSHHEVYIDDRQVQWLEEQVQEHADKPILIFTHAPPMGCGLKVLQEVHIKNRCAWLNHSDRPRRFIELVQRHKNIRLWFSGHFHLSHNYIDSVSPVGTTAFVQTGVIGTCNRDGNRQSRMVTGDSQGYKLYTLDHETGSLRLDLEHGWWDTSVPVPVTPEEELICDASSPWLCSAWDSTVGADQAKAQWLPAGRDILLAHQDKLLVEYDSRSFAPIGLVTRATQESSVRLLDASGKPASEDDGSDAVVVEVLDPATGETRSFPRNDGGGFYQIFQPNKWRLNQEKLRREAEIAAAAAAGIKKTAEMTTH